MDLKVQLQIIANRLSRVPFLEWMVILSGFLALVLSTPLIMRQMLTIEAAGNKPGDYVFNIALDLLLLNVLVIVLALLLKLIRRIDKKEKDS